MSLGRTLVALLLVTAPITAAATGLGDGPAAGDASDDPNDPTVVPGPGTYNGTLAPVGDADWYAFLANDTQTGTPSCIEIGAEGLANARLNLTMDQGPAYYALGNLTPDHGASVGLAVPAFQNATFGLEPYPSNRSFGPYTLTVDRHTLDRTSSTTTDGSGSAESSETAQGPCLDGTLDPGEQTNHTFNATTGDRLVLSLAQAASGSVQVSLVSPSNKTVRTLGPDASVVHQRLNETGNWTVELENPASASTSSFLVGLSLADDCQLLCFMQDPEEEEEDEDDRCQPYCMATEIS